MSDNKSVVSQWGKEEPVKPISNTAADTKAKEKAETEKGPETKTKELTISEILKRRGFFEAISIVECPLQKLTAILNEYRKVAEDKMKEIDERTNIRIKNLEELVASTNTRIIELKEKLKEARQYRETEDTDLQKLIAEKQKEEEELIKLQQQLTSVRIKLGEAKAGIINKSLDEAEKQVKKALDIQRIIYDEVTNMNIRKFNDEKDYRAILSKYFTELHKHYEERYQKIKTHLKILDADAVSPVTNRTLATIGSISFVAAGFFFSTFAGAAGFGNEDMLYHIFNSILRSINGPWNFFLKVAILLGLILLVTGISWACNYLLYSRKREFDEDESDSEMTVEAEVKKKLDDLEYYARIKSNNWYAFWLQIIPGVFIAGLVILVMSAHVSADNLSAVNSSSEGLIIGTCIAMSLAGLIYLYIIKVVEPRLLKKYQADPNSRINWFRANWELVMVIAVFLIFSICIIAIPYVATKDEFKIVPVGPRTRYAMLLFIAMCLAGSIAFAYSVRSLGLMTTNGYIERALRWLNTNIAYYTAPRSAPVYNRLSEENATIVEHVLRQLSFNAAINHHKIMPVKRRIKPQTAFQKLIDAVKSLGSDREKTPREPIDTVTRMEPWEEKYFPHIVDELKAVEFEYREKKAKLQKAQDAVDDYKAAKAIERKQFEIDIQTCVKNILEHAGKIEMALKDKSVQYQEVRIAYNVDTGDFLDGFHLGMWYRENGMGPTPGFFNSCAPVKPVNPPLLLTANSNQA